MASWKCGPNVAPLFCVDASPKCLWDKHMGESAASHAESQSMGNMKKIKVVSVMKYDPALTDYGITVFYHTECHGFSNALWSFTDYNDLEAP